MSNNINPTGLANFKLLLKSLYKDKLLIGIVALIVFIISVLYSFLNAVDVYESKATLYVKTDIETVTPFGIFKMPFTSVEEYDKMISSNSVINLTAEKLSFKSQNSQILSSINSTANKGLKTLSIQYEGQSSVESLELANKHLESYKEYLELLLIDTAVSNFITDLENKEIILENQIKVFEENISQNENLLSQIPKFLDSDNDAAYQDRVINPLYEQIAYTTAILKTDLTKQQNDLISTKSQLEILNDGTNLNGLRNIFKNIITIIDNPEEGTLIKSQNLKFDMALGVIFGLMLGVIVAFIKDYWKRA